MVAPCLVVVASFVGQRTKHACQMSVLHGLQSPTAVQVDSIDQSAIEWSGDWIVCCGLCIVCVWVEWVVGGLRYLVLMMPVAATAAAAATVAEVFPGKAFAMFCFMFYECVCACVWQFTFYCRLVKFSVASFPFPLLSDPSLCARHASCSHSHLMLLLIKLSLASGRVFFFRFFFFCLSSYACGVDKQQQRSNYSHSCCLQ